MSDPYRPPDAALGESDGAHRPSRFVLFLSLALTALTALTVSLAAASFGPVLSAFDAALPWLTRTLMTVYPILWLLPVIAAAAWFGWPIAAQRRRIVLAIGLISLLLILPICFIALYLPIFKLAAVV